MVLSRVKSLNGLFLCKPLSMDKTFKVDDDLLAFERRMEFLQKSVLTKMDLSDAPLDDEDSRSEKEVVSGMDCDAGVSTGENLTMVHERTQEAAGCHVTTDNDEEMTEGQVGDCDMDCSEERLTTGENRRNEGAGSEVPVNFDDLFLQEASLLPYMSFCDVQEEIMEHKSFYQANKSDSMGKKAVLLLMEYWAFTYVRKMSRTHRMREIHCWQIVFDKSSATGKWVREKSLVHATADFNTLWKKTSANENTPTVQSVAISGDKYPADFNFDDEIIKASWQLRHTSIVEVRRELNVLKRLYYKNNSEYMGKRAVLLLMKYWAIRIIIDLAIRNGLPEEECWNTVLEDASKHQRLMENVRSRALCNFTIGWKKLESVSTRKIQVNKL